MCPSDCSEGNSSKATSQCLTWLFLKLEAHKYQILPHGQSHRTLRIHILFGENKALGDLSTV